MVRQQKLVHNGEPAVFVMRVAGSYSSALSRQVGEAGSGGISYVTEYWI